MGKKIIKLILFAGIVYLLFCLGRFYLSVKHPKLLEDLQTLTYSFRQPISQAKKKATSGELVQGKYNFLVFEKLENVFHQANLKNLFQKLGSSGKIEKVGK